MSDEPREIQGIDILSLQEAAQWLFEEIDSVPNDNQNTRLTQAAEIMCDVFDRTLADMREKMKMLMDASHQLVIERDNALADLAEVEAFIDDPYGIEENNLHPLYLRLYELLNQELEQDRQEMDELNADHQLEMVEDALMYFNLSPAEREQLAMVFCNPDTGLYEDPEEVAALLYKLANDLLQNFT